MTAERKIVWGVAAALSLVVVALLLLPRLEEELAPEPVAAWVAIEPDGSGVADAARVVEMASGSRFTLHAVLEAEGRGGRRVYYTEARRLRVRGEEIPARDLRHWDRRHEARILWFTVEGFAPYLEVAGGVGLGRFRFEETFRPDWARTWAVPGSLEPGSARLAPGAEVFGPYPFGTQRYHVRIELHAAEGSLMPVARFKSWGAEELPARAAEFPTAVAALPSPLGVASEVFGLTKIAAAGGFDERQAATVAEWTRLRVAFSRLHLLRGILRERGTALEALAWRRVDLADGPAWGEGGAAAGDLLRVGERVVVLYRDAGSAGGLDRGDLCFDYDQGAAVRSLEEVFAGDGLVEWAALR